MRCRFALIACFSFIMSLTLLVGCGGSSNSNNATSSNTPAASGSGSASSGSGSSGSGSAGSGSSGSGSSGSQPGSGTSGGSSSSGSGTGSSPSFVAYAYTASTSQIWGYGVSSNGSLTAISGSPFAASIVQGTNIVTNGANIYAIDEISQGVNNLDIFSINKSSGALTRANSTSATSGYPNTGDPAFALSLDHTGSSLYVGVGLTDFNGGINAFMVGSGSSAQQFQYLPTGAVSFPPLVFSPDNQYAYASTVFYRSEGVYAFTRASDGTLKQMNLAPATEPTVTGEVFSPAALAVSAKGYMAVVWVRNFMCCGAPGNNAYVMTYKINSDGTLAAVSGSQQETASTTDQQSASYVAANFDPSGSVLAMAGNGGIQTYSLNGNGTLTPVGSPQNAGVIFQNLAWDSSNHVFATDASHLYVYNSSGGVLTAASGSPYAGGQGLTVLPLQ